MSWIAAQAGSRRVSPQDLPGYLRQVLSFVEAWPAIVEGSIQCYRTERADCKYAVCFQFFWDRPARIVELRIQVPEAIALWFKADASPETAPQVRADRDDFPRDLAHLNGIVQGDPASLCLARESLHSVYARKGIAGILERLNTWLRDAATGDLDHDGWEPIPRSCYYSATLDISAFQRLALSSKRDKPGIAHGFSLAVFDEDQQGSKNFHFQLLAKQRQLAELEDKVQLAALTKRREVFPSRWFSAWGPKNVSVSKRFWESVTNCDSLLRYAEIAGCKNEVEWILVQNLKYADSGGAPAFVLLIGTWRSKPLVRTIPGLAQGEAANLELAGFTVWPKKEDGQRHKMDLVCELRLLAEANSQNLNRFAGYLEQPGNTVLIGAGALGSKLAEHIVREGAPSLKVVDHDVLAPHNLARHSLSSESIYFPKATELGLRLNAINPSCQVMAISRNFALLAPDTMKKDICEGAKGVIVDATADISVTRRLCQPDNVMRVAKVELAHGGRLGLLYNEGKGRRPRIDDLKALIPALGTDVQEIADWLRDKDDFRLDIGVGCASASMQMSDSRVALHAANFMASLGSIIRLADHPAGIGIAVLGQRGHFKEWRWIKEDPPEVLKAKDANESWTVRMRKSIRLAIERELEARKPVEAGGYLYGAYDLRLRTIYVTTAIPVQPREASASRIRLPEAGKSSVELELRKFSGDQIALLGTWHTHPAGSPGPSERDIQQFKEDAGSYARTPSPHLMLIFSETGLTLNLSLPEAWKGDER